MKRRILIVAPFFCSQTPGNRPALIINALKRDYNITLITTAFDHQAKKNRTVELQGVQVKTLKSVHYHHNISPHRFISHLQFSLKASWFLWNNRGQFDLVYSTLPLNLFALSINPLKKNEATKIVDVVDIWPDVLPFPVFAKKLFYPCFWLWKKVFIAAVSKVDAVLAVSESFMQETKKYTPSEAIHRVVYLAHPEINAEHRRFKDGQRLRVAYIGNIGHLYDFQTLLDAIKCSGSDKFHLDIIGDGDKRHWLLKEIESIGCSCTYHGTVFDRQSLSKILANTDIGFNGYLNSNASFSYKSATYIAAGLPVLNSMPGDLNRLIDQYGFGVNYDPGNVDSLAKTLDSINSAALKNMREKVSLFYKEFLEPSRVEEDVRAIISKVLKND